MSLENIPKTNPKMPEQKTPSSFRGKLIAIVKEIYKLEQEKQAKLKEIREGIGQKNKEELDKRGEEVKSLRLEIQRLTEGKDALMREQEEKQPKALSRRGFLKVAAGVAGALALGSAPVGKEHLEKRAKPQTRVEKRSAREEIEHQISECRKIIDEERYEDILKNPYLVSALYYSPQSIKKMSTLGQAEEIIWNVYHLITRQFRENYIQTLKKLIEEKNTKLKEINTNKESSPLEIINWVAIQRNHPDAIDLFTPEGSAIHSVSRGIVVLAENGWNIDAPLSTTSMRGGNTVIVFNPKDESFYRYAHMQKALVSVGKILRNGEIIGVVGHTGTNASKPEHGRHLHFEINQYDQKMGSMVSTSVLDLQKKLKSLKIGTKD